jgi:hypothetical protein
MYDGLMRIWKDRVYLKNEAGQLAFELIEKVGLRQRVQCLPCETFRRSAAPRRHHVPGLWTPKCVASRRASQRAGPELSGAVTAAIRSLSEQMINLSNQELLEELWDSDGHICQSLR